MEKHELETDRLFMRPFRADDAEVMYNLNEDTEVLQYTGDKQFSDVEACRNFLREYDQYEKYNTGRLIVILKETGEILGWSGLKYHPDVDEYDIGYRFYKKHWGYGYASESAIAAMAYGFKILGLKRIVGNVHKENTASMRVLEKLNMTYFDSYVEDGQYWLRYECYNPYL